MEPITTGTLVAFVAKNATDLLGPTIKSVGQTINDLYLMAFGNSIHFAVEKQKIGYEQSLEDFKLRTQNKFENIPVEYLCEPEIHTLAAILDSAKFSITEEQLREMYANLIAATVDSRKKESIHPLFAQTIKSMSSLDAQNFKLFRSKQLPVAQYRLQFQQSSFSNLETDVFLENPEEQDRDKQRTSLAVLTQLGLVNVSYQTELKDTGATTTPNGGLNLVTSRVYDKYKPHNLQNFQFKDIAIAKYGIAELTAYGLALLDICLPNEENQSLV